MGLPEEEQHQLDRIERELNGADLRFPSSQKTNTAGRRRAFSAGAVWFLGMMLLVAGAVMTMQGPVIFGVVAVVAGLAAVAVAAVALMS
jgi:hypothetical protein